MHFNPSLGLLNNNFDALVLANFHENILQTILGQQLSHDWFLKKPRVNGKMFRHN